MKQKVFLLTPPFTQLNTPYPATAYLKGYLSTLNISTYQADLGIEVILSLFSKAGLNKLFKQAQLLEEHSINSKRIFHLQKEYIATIDGVIDFLQGNNPDLAHVICEGNFLPEASRFDQSSDLEWAFGTMGNLDKAKHLSTLYLEDISDFIVEIVDPHFGFSRYAERLGRSANSFDELYTSLQKESTLIDDLLLQSLQEHIEREQPTIVGVSVPFPGNLYAAFKCAQWIRKNHPSIHLVMGGGFPNTELRSLSDPRVFEFFNYITLDDGETPFRNLIEFIEGERTVDQLKRCFSLQENQVQYHNGSSDEDVAHKDTGTPDYSDLLLHNYLSVIEIANPMHRLWSDGRWNKLTLAHGCYWGKCTFCDISLDYIRRYEPVAAKHICDQLEQIIEQTGQNGFHFVDEAAPPALMREVALEILRRRLTVVWWTNIRFEKNFTADLCRLLKESGCIAVSGGLEVASDRLLDLIQKGVTVSQVAQVANHFTQANIMVHAYLMYGFPTQTDQETIDALEMVRQLFELGVVQSGFWHQFAMTAHSPVGINPEKFKVVNKSPLGSFANNDLIHSDPEGTNHSLYSEGLKKSLFNYMHGVCFDFHLSEWFDHKVPVTSIPKNYISTCLDNTLPRKIQRSTRFIWLGNQPISRNYFKKKKGKEQAMLELIFHNKKEDFVLNTKEDLGIWLRETLLQLSFENEKFMNFSQLEQSFQQSDLGDFSTFIESPTFQQLSQAGLLIQ